MVVLVRLDHSSGNTKPLDIARFYFQCIATQLVFMALKSVLQASTSHSFYADKSPGHLVKVPGLIQAVPM